MVALLNSSKQYCATDKYAAVTTWAATTIKVAGTLVRQLTTPTLGDERVYVCIVAGTTNSTEPAWTGSTGTTKGAKVVDNTVTWQECTGQPGVNGDIVNSPVWGVTLTVIIGQIIYDSVSGALQICSTAGTTKSGTQPTFSATAGVTTADNTVTWTSLGAASGFAAWAAPHKRVLNADATTWQTVVPATVWLSPGHTETQTVAMSLAGGQSTAAASTSYICCSSSSVAPPTAAGTTASINITTGTVNLSITSNNSYWYGVTFTTGTAGSNVQDLLISNAAGQQALYFESCNFETLSTSTTNLFFIGSTNCSDAIFNFLNCTFVFGSTSQKISTYSGEINFIGGSIAATGSSPATLFLPLATLAQNVTVRDCDLSGITGTILNVGIASPGEFLIENCKLGSGVAMTTGAVSSPGGIMFRLHNCDSGSKNYRFYESDYESVIQQETTIVDNTNPCSNGAQQFSWNIATNATISFGAPYISPEIAQWNSLTSGTHTATVQIAGANTLTNGDIWMELEYPGNASFPIDSIVNNRVADILTAVSAQPTSTDSWGGSPAHTQYLQVSFTPLMAGPIIARIYVAKPSITVYVNPLIVVV